MSNNIASLDLQADFERVDAYSNIAQLQRYLTFDYKTVIENGVKRLQGYKCDLLIASLLKNETEYDTLVNDLAIIDLPLSAGVIIGIEKFAETAWRKALEKELSKVARRFVFIEIVETSAWPWRAVDDALGHLADKHAPILAKAGWLRSDYWVAEIVRVKREELRLIMKQLSFELVLWLDTNEKVPQDILHKLLRHTDKADIIAAWSYEPTLDQVFTNVHTSKPFKIETERDKQWYEASDEAALRFFKALEEATLQEIPFSIDNYPIAPWQLQAESEPIDLAQADLDCALVKKQVIDECSFIAEFYENSACAHNIFSTHARMSGFRLVVDPTAYIEYVS